MDKWNYPNPYDDSPGFGALELTEEEWPSLAARDDSVVEPNSPEIVDVTFWLYASVGLDEGNEESVYDMMRPGDDTTYVHHSTRYRYGADDHLYPEID